MSTAAQALTDAADAIRDGVPLDPAREAIVAWLEEEARFAGIRHGIWRACGHDPAECAEHAFRHPLAVARALAVEVGS